jgi:hypothetical protein
MTDHRNTPPPKLLDQWLAEWAANDEATGPQVEYVATAAARWGSDQELEACVEWASCFNYDDYHYDEVLRDIRRPKPPSLKEQALQALDLLKVDASTHGLGFDSSTIRRALESLPD